MVQRKSKQTNSFLPGKIVLASAAYKSYPADSSVAFCGSLAKTVSAKYFTVTVFDMFFFK